MAGCDIVRCTCNEPEAAEGLARIVPRSPVPIVADIHHQYRMALAALEAGVHCLRLNPGNIRKPEHIKLVAQEAKDRGVPIRIGVNGGSLRPRPLREVRRRVTPEAMVESAQMELAYFDEVGFDDVKISVKASNVPLMIEAYRQLADAVDHPLHLGVTEAGPPPGGLIKATAGIATLLAEGIGDTIRYSLTADPVEEARAGRQLLEALGLRERKDVDLIACPSCGRAEIDVIEVARQAQEAFERQADPAPGRRDGLRGQRSGRGPRRRHRHRRRARTSGHLFVKGKNVAVVPEDEMVDALVEWADVHRRGRRRGRARAGPTPATPRARGRADRAALLDEQGADANAQRAARRAHPQALSSGTRPPGHRDGRRTLTAWRGRWTPGEAGPSAACGLGGGGPAVVVVHAVLGTVFAVVRGRLLLALFGVVAWVVLVGPPEGATEGRWRGGRPWSTIGTRPQRNRHVTIGTVPALCASPLPPPPASDAPVRGHAPALGALAALVALAGDGQSPPAAVAPRDAGARRRRPPPRLLRHLAARRGVRRRGARRGSPIDRGDGGRDALLDEATFARLSVAPEPMYGDLDGDGREEAVVRTTCAYGANGAEDTVQVWSANGRLPMLVDTVGGAPRAVADDSRFPPVLQDVAIAGDRLELTYGVFDDDAPHCCPSGRAVVTYELDGGLAVVGEAVVEPID